MRICFNPLNDRRIKLQEADSNRRSQEYESCEIPFLYPAIYVSFQHICTGNPQADCFLHLGQYPHISYSDEIMGEDGVEPPEPESNRFTVCTATSTEYSPKTRAPRVSNMFIVLCFPLGCFMPCQPHEVVSDIIMPFDFMFLENSLVINARL